MRLLLKNLVCADVIFWVICILLYTSYTVYCSPYCVVLTTFECQTSTIFDDWHSCKAVRRSTDSHIHWWPSGTTLQSTDIFFHLLAQYRASKLWKSIAKENHISGQLSYTADSGSCFQISLTSLRYRSGIKFCMILICYKMYQLLQKMKWVAMSANSWSR